MAHGLDNYKEAYEKVLENPEAHPVNPPYTYEARLERLYDLTRMVYKDEHIADTHQLYMLRKLAVALGFSDAYVNYIIDKALKLVSRNVDLETITLGKPFSAASTMSFL